MSPCSRVDSRTRSPSSVIFSTVVASLSVAPAAVARSASAASNSSRITSVSSGPGQVRVFCLFPSKLNENERACALGFSASPSGSACTDALTRPPPQVLYRGSVARSSRMTRLPARAASRAAVAPAGPAPITATSQISASVTNSFTSRSRLAYAALPHSAATVDEVTPAPGIPLYRLAWGSRNPDPARRPGQARLPQPDAQLRRGIPTGAGAETGEHREEVPRRRRPAGGFGERVRHGHPVCQTQVRHKVRMRFL